MESFTFIRFLETLGNAADGLIFLSQMRNLVSRAASKQYLPRAGVPFCLKWRIKTSRGWILFKQWKGRINPANKSSRQVFSLISAYQHSINIFEPLLLLLLLLPSRSRIYANLLPFTPPPCIFIFSIFIFPIQSCSFFLAPSSPIFFKKINSRERKIQFSNLTLKTWKLWKKENLSGLKFNHPKNIREKKKDPKIKEFNRTLKP